MRTAVQKTRVSWHHGGPIEGPLKLLESSQHYRIEEVLSHRIKRQSTTSKKDIEKIYIFLYRFYEVKE